ncbi:MAG: histone deacetylase family protein [Rhizomicrobium sp.]
MSTGLITHAACFDHVTPPGHPERVDRLHAVLRALDETGFAQLIRIDAPRADRDALLRVHAPSLVELVLNARIAPGHFELIDADTAMSSGSPEAALRAAGAVITAVDRIMAGEFANAFCAVRPPGHHAEKARAMGFCLFNNIAVGALHARAAHGLSRIAVVDFDVHHGNGTQDIFFDDRELFYASTHQWPLYPGTGSSAETGIGANIVNAPLAPGSGSREFRAAFEDVVLPALDAFSPQFLFISAGFDAHEADPLASLRLKEEDFAWATKRLCEAASRHCDGRVVSALEGGYDLEALGRSVAAHVNVLTAGGEA